jgi:hypothetical protein
MLVPSAYNQALIGQPGDRDDEPEIISNGTNKNALPGFSRQGALN